MSYHHFTTFERGRIQKLLSFNCSHRTIAKKLGSHCSSIDREVRRSASAADYTAEVAHAAYKARHQHAKPKDKCVKDLVAAVAEKLQATWSPEQISNTGTLGTVSFKTIYNWLYAGLLPTISINNLQHKGKRRKTENCGKFSMGTSMSERTKEVESRAPFGHWELDSMVSSRGESKGCLVTFVERKSRLYNALKMPDRTAASMEAAIELLYHTLPAGECKTGTTDRGKEFACCTSVKAKLRLILYFADAYSSWQRGNNENSNGLLHEFYPKKTDLALVKQDELTHNLFLINSRPRKCLAGSRLFKFFCTKWRT